MTAVARTRAELATLGGKAAGRRGFVPTMGALHEGHASLMRVARKEVGRDGTTVVSIFVNPTQFAAHEDLSKYPRTWDTDLAMCEREGVDVVYAPGVADVYPHGDSLVTVDPGELGGVLEGAIRPTHFRGVLTVVAKLFGAVRPEVAVFGEKDYQQLALIRHMANELCLGVEVVGAPTIREDDGLAMSSRNRYLDDSERLQAAGVSAALRAVQSAAAQGAAPAHAREAGLAELAAWPRLELQYLEVRRSDLTPYDAAPPAGSEGRALIAVRLGQTRLIDNMPVRFSDATR